MPTYNKPANPAFAYSWGRSQLPMGGEVKGRDKSARATGLTSLSNSRRIASSKRCLGLFRKEGRQHARSLMVGLQMADIALCLTAAQRLPKAERTHCNIKACQAVFFENGLCFEYLP